MSEGYNTKQDLNKYVHQNSLMRTRSDLYLFSESLWAVRTGNGQIGISSLRSGLKALSVSVNLAGVHRYMESICWYAECHSNTLWNQGGNADYFVPFQIIQSGKGFFNSIKEF